MISKLISSIRKKNYLFLIEQFTITDFKLRYSQSILGYLWSLLNPLLMFSVLYIVFSVFMRFENVKHYQVYLLSGIIIWNYFADATGGGMQSMLSKSVLLNKIFFSRIIIPASSILTSTITLLINLIVLTAFIILSRVHVNGSAFMAIVLLIELILLSFSVSLILTSFFLKFRDLIHLWTVLIQLGFWATPIVYPAEIIPKRFQFIGNLNPIARIIQNFRKAVIYGESIYTNDILYTMLVVVILFIFGFYIFNKNQKYFAEWV